MNKIFCEVQDTKKLGSIHLDLDLLCYAVFEDHLIIEMRTLPKEKDIFEFITKKKLDPEESFTLIIDGNVFYGCQGLAVGSIKDCISKEDVFNFYITFESKQDAN